MPTEVPADTPGCSPDAAFAAVGNETRIQILRALGEADGPLTFSALHDATDYNSSSNFAYHLDRLTDQFIKTDGDGYQLTSAGRRIVEAIHSGAITETPRVDRTPVDIPCHFCGGVVEVRYAEERLERFCTECEGMWGSQPDGFLGALSLPPVGLQHRTLDEAVKAAWLWQQRDLFSIAARLCPRCSDRLDHELLVCEDHSQAGDRCPACSNRYAASLRFACHTCGFGGTGSLPLILLDQLAMMRFFVDQRLHPVQPDSITDYHRIVSDYEETVRSVAPPEVVLTFRWADASISFLIEADLTVTQRTV